MGITGVARSHAGDGKRKGQWDVHRVTVGAETDFAARKAVHKLKCGISARFPSFPDSQRRLSFINVTRPFHTVFSVFFVATVSAITADNAVKSGANRGNRVFSFAENPDLDHVAGFPIVGSFGEAGGDHDTDVILVENKAVQRTPPTRSSATQ